MTSVVEEDCKVFVEWLQHKAGTIIVDSLAIRESSLHGIGLYASRNIAYHSRILKIPFGLQPSSGNLPPNLSSMLTGAEIDDAAKLAIVILHEKKLGHNSEWAPYINRLPLPHDMHSTIFWTHEELQMILPASDLYEHTQKLKTHIQNTFTALTSLQFDFFTLEEFKYAYAIVMSRAWKNHEGILFLIPLLDFVNHDDAKEGVVRDDVDEKHWELIVFPRYAAGDEIGIRYGEALPNTALLLKYGFTVTPNAHDFVTVEVSVDDRDDKVLYDKKTDVLRRQRTRKGNVVMCGWNVFWLNYVFDGEEKEGGIPKNLRAFFRIVACESEKELEEMCESTGDRVDERVAANPLNNVEKEIAAHRLLRQRICELIEKRNAMDFGAPHLCEKRRKLDFAAPHHLCEKRRKLAEDVIQGELRLLKTACDWLDDYLCELKS